MNNMGRKGSAAVLARITRVSQFRAAVAAGSPTGIWRMSGHPAVQSALRNHYFDSLGLPRLYVPDHYAEIKVRSLGTRISWRTLLADLTALGLNNAHGRPVQTTKALRNTYNRVRQLKRREAEARALLPPRDAPPPEPRLSPASPFTQNSLFSLEEQLPGLFGPITNRGADDG